MIEAMELARQVTRNYRDIPDLVSDSESRPPAGWREEVTPGIRSIHRPFSVVRKPGRLRSHRTDHLRFGSRRYAEADLETFYCTVLGAVGI